MTTVTAASLLRLYFSGPSLSWATVSGVVSLWVDWSFSKSAASTPPTPTTTVPSLELFFWISSIALTKLAKLSSAFWLKISTTAGRPSPPYFQT